MMDQLKLEAQKVLDELFIKGTLPFKLSARVIDPIGGDEYIVRFHDSRLRSVDLSWPSTSSFKDAFRAAMLERVRQIRRS